LLPTYALIILVRTAALIGLAVALYRLLTREAVDDRA